MPHEPWALRAATLRRVDELGFPPPPPHYPVLFDEAGYRLRPSLQIAARAAVLNVMLARTYGLPEGFGYPWVERNGLARHLSPSEREFLVDGAEADVAEVRSQVEALWALMWVLGPVRELDPADLCDDSLARLLPDLNVGQPFSEWMKWLPSPRSADDVMAELDLHYCLTWGLADANLSGREPPGAIPQYALWQRRRALEWAMESRGNGADEWDDVDLST